MVKKTLFKYSSVLMSVVLIASTLTACGTNTAYNQVSSEVAVSSEAASNTESIISNAIKNELSVSNTSTLKTNTRDEMVYVFGKADGTQDHVTVTEKVTDVNGDTTTNQSSSSKSAPVSMKVTYKLNGVETKPEDMIGKSGKVTIRYDYTNNEKKTIKVNGKSQTAYVPFTMITGTLLPTDKFSNVEVTNGKVSKVGDNIIALGMTMPGLKDTLNLKFDGESLDMDIPEYFEISADVNDFELDMSMSVATTSVLNDVDVDDFSLAKLEDKMNELQSAADQLTDGTVTLQDGTQTLADSIPALTDGVNQLNDGAGTLKNGIYAYTDGATALAAGAGQLKDGITAYTDGASKLSAGATQLKGGLSTYTAGVAQLAKGSDTLTTGIAAYTTGASKLSAGAGTLKKGIKDYTDGVAQLADGSTQLKDGLSTYTAGVAAAASGTADLKSGINAYTTGAKNLGNGAAALKKGINDYTAGVTKAADGALQVSNGVSQLKKMLTDKMAAELKNNITAYKTNQNITTDVENLTKAAVQAGLSDITIADDLTVLAKTSETEKIEAKITEMYNKYLIAYTNSVVNNGAGSQLTGLYASQLGLLVKASGNQGAASALSQVATQLAASTGSLETLEKGAEDVSNGLNTLNSMNKTLNDGAEQLNDGLVELNKNNDNLNNGIASLDTGVSTLNSSNEKLNTGASQLQAGVVKLNENSKALNDGVAQIDTGLTELNGNNKALNDGAAQINGGLVQLNANNDTINGGIDQIDSGLITLNANNSTLNGGIAQLYNGFATLNANNPALRDGSSQLADGTSTLKSSSATLADGVTQLNDGAITLKDGMAEFNASGIKAITSLVGNDADTAVDTIKEVIKLGKNYNSFLDKKDGKESSVTFIYKTAELTK
jgi:putative membrane protein